MAAATGKTAPLPPDAQPMSKPEVAAPLPPLVDLHCHLLPGIDDGPDTLAEALDLARAAVADGVTHAALTSHLNPELYPNTGTSLQQATTAFNAALAQANIPLDVRTGAEARLCPELLDLLAANDVPFLGTVDGWRILLLEFPHAMVPVGSERFIQHLLGQGIRPLLAHPERNKAIMTQPERIAPMVEAGCWLQITAGSVLGHFGPAAQNVAFRLIESDWTCLLATDTHNLHNRPPVLSAGVQALRQRYGDTVAERMGLRLPAQIFGLTSH